MDFEFLLENYKEEIIRTTQDFIKIKSVRGKPESGMPYGKGPYEALQYILSLSEGMGFSVKDVDGYAGHAELGEGDETVGVLVHLDVVAEGEGWTFPPFSGEIHDGKLYGRGAIDDKGPTIAALYALKILKDSGMKLKRKIRIVFGTDEENGYDGIRYYLSKEEPFDMGFTPDANFPLISGEKGIFLYRLSKRISSNIGGTKSIKGGNAPNMVPGYCEAYIDKKCWDESELKHLIDEFKLTYGYEINMDAADDCLILSSKGKTAHGSTPEAGLNAISIMMLFLNRLNAKDEVSNLIKIYNEKIGMQYNGESINCSCFEDISGKLTLNVGKMDVSDSSLEMEKLFALDPICFSEEHFLIQKLTKVYKDITGEGEAKPLIIGGATYARAIKNVVAFGPVFPDEAELAHKSDEYISLENLMKLTQIYTYALYELSR